MYKVLLVNLSRISTIKNKKAHVQTWASYKGINANDALVIHASNYVENFGVEKHTAYAVLKEASKVLFDRRFTYQSLTDKGNVKTTHCRWIRGLFKCTNQSCINLIK